MRIIIDRIQYLKGSVIGFGLLLLFQSCNKEAKYPYQFAGTWKIDKIEITTYSDKGTTVQESSIMDQPGLMQLTNLTDSYFENSSQLAVFAFPGSLPKSMSDFCGESGITNRNNFSAWYVAGPHGTERLSFWHPLKLGNSIVIYTVKKIKRNNMELVFTSTDSDGFLIHREVWYCTIAK
jgi:hypothetical protein